MIALKYDKALIAKAKLNAVLKKLSPEIDKLSSASYQGERGCINLPIDEQQFRIIDAAVSLKKRLNPKLIIVVGIGGSNLGTIAVQEALLGRQWNLHNEPRIMYADTVDPDALQVIIAEMQAVLRQGKQVILNIVSKSGSTTETVANFEVLLNVLRRHRKDAAKYVIVTTDKGSKLWNLGMKNNFSLLEIPEKVGGRYSVFSAVGLFPLGMLGINLKELLDGAAEMRRKCLSINGPAAINAALIYLHNKSGRNIYDNFFFASDLESLGKWHRQLLAESLGKDGKGITPTVSIGSTDLHSVAQLYLDGPQDKFTNFIITHFNEMIKVPSYPEYDALVPDLQKKELNHIIHAIVKGTKKAFAKSKRPFTETRLDGKNANSIGAFMEMKMIETILLGKLLGVNPFGQPAVELYKKETKRFLRSGNL
ncbi:MAG TPA: glucose-6-phosphate isomerase [Candidatus Nanoarchaeia archaeon]|nr:glucose-6-phosphate isomerase [Candidatus Nanoarchaeia archaeon]